MPTYRFPCIGGADVFFIPPDMTIAEIERRNSENMQIHTHVIEAETLDEARAFLEDLGVAACQAIRAAIKRGSEMGYGTEPPLLLRMEDAARLLSVGRSTLYKLIASGDIPIVRIGGVARVSRAALESWIEQRSRKESR
jgi:excisionase family DNA binding protein